MSEGILLAVFSVIAASLAALAGLLWRHVEHCKDVHAQLASISSDLKRVMQEIGTHETGMRGTIHRQAQDLTRHEYEIEALKKRAVK